MVDEQGIGNGVGAPGGSCTGTGTFGHVVGSDGPVGAVK